MKFLWISLAVVVLSGCATQAHRAVQQECAQTALMDYPVNQIQMVQTRQRVVHVSMGMSSCFTSRDGRHAYTMCNDMSRPELIPYQETVVIDQNEAVRKMAVASCTVNLCQQRYGNAECKTDQLLVPVQ